MWNDGEIRIEDDGVSLTILTYSHYRMPGEFLCLCLMNKPPEEYIGRLFSSTENKDEVTCQDCLELIHA